MSTGDAHGPEAPECDAHSRTSPTRGKSGYDAGMTVRDEVPLPGAIRHDGRRLVSGKGNTRFTANVDDAAPILAPFVRGADKSAVHPAEIAEAARYFRRGC